MTSIERITEFVQQEFAGGNVSKMIGPDDPLLTSAGGIIDSVGLQTFILQLESDFEIVIDDLDLLPDNFSTLNCVAAFVEAKLSAPLS